MSARDLLANATPRPWGLDPVHPSFIGGNPIGSEHEWQEVVVDSAGAAVAEDAALIVAAVNEYEALLALEKFLRADTTIAWHLGTSSERAVGDALARLDAVRSGT